MIYKHRFIRIYFYFYFFKDFGNLNFIDNIIHLTGYENFMNGQIKIDMLGCLNALIKYLDVRLLNKLILKNNLKIIFV